MSPGEAVPDTREPGPPWKDKKIVLGVCGGVAAYKVVQVARDLSLYGATVDVVLTRAARRFVTPLSFEGVTGRRAFTDLFSAREAALHVALGSSADCVCVAPATADFIARVAAGRANDLLACVLLATEAPVVVAPAMNDRMFAHPRTRANLAHLEGVLGYRRTGPARGRLAAGEGRGRGRMVDPEDIVEAVGRALTGESRLRGAQVLVTAGPTREPLDPVRYLGNRSSGRMGFALARSAWRRGAEVTLVTGPSLLTPPGGVTLVPVRTAAQMRDAVLARIGAADVAVHAAAVSDYRPAFPAAGKIKRARAGSQLDVKLVENPDIAAESGPAMKARSVSVGFALETSDLLVRAQEKLVAKGFDFIVANAAGKEGVGFETVTNRVAILNPGQPPLELPLMSKSAVADEIMDRVEDRLEEKRRA